VFQRLKIFIHPEFRHLKLTFGLALLQKHTLVSHVTLSINWKMKTLTVATLPLKEWHTGANIATESGCCKIQHSSKQH